MHIDALRPAAAALTAAINNTLRARGVHGLVWVNDGGEGGVARALAIRWQQTKALSGPTGSLV